MTGPEVGVIEQPDDMACQEFVELVTDYFENALDPALRARVEQHLLACEGCTSYLEQMRDTLRVAGSLQPDDIPAPAMERLLAAFRLMRRDA